MVIVVIYCDFTVVKYRDLAACQYRVLAACRYRDCAACRCGGLTACRHRWYRQRRASGAVTLWVLCTPRTTGPLVIDVLDRDFTTYEYRDLAACQYRILAAGRYRDLAACHNRDSSACRYRSLNFLALIFSFSFYGTRASCEHHMPDRRKVFPLFRGDGRSTTDRVSACPNSHEPSA